MVFKRECLQCGKKGFFLSLDSNGLCEACRQKIEAARITSKKIQAESFYDRLVTLSRKVLIDPCTCSPEDIRCAHDNCPSFIETLDAIPSIPAFAEAFLAHCSHSNALLVINEDFGPMRLSSGGVCDFGELRTKATHSMPFQRLTFALMQQLRSTVPLLSAPML